MKKFSQKQVLKDIIDYRNGKLLKFNSAIIDAWYDMAEKWLTNNPYCILTHGLKGFNERTPEEILVDFHFSNLLKRPLSAKKLDKIWGVKNCDQK